MRVDAWLWTARLCRTRALATAAARGGHVRIAGAAVKPGREVRIGEVIELTSGPAPRTVIVRGQAPRRVSAAEAAALYEETAESLAERERRAAERALLGPVASGGRPTGRDRRRLRAQRGR